MLILVAVAIGILATSMRVLNEYERGVVFRLGRVMAPRGPGVIFLMPGLEKMVRVDLRTITLDVPPQDIISKDNVTIKVNAVIYFRVVDPVHAVVDVENFLMATSKLAQTTLRSVVGQVDMDTLLSSRDTINHRLQAILDSQTATWGVKVLNVEIKQVDLPVEMQRAMAKQAEAERERRAKVISAEGEFEASLRLAEAAKNMQQQPMSLQLRYLQTIREMSTERATTTIVPFPVELLKFFGDYNGKEK